MTDRDRRNARAAAADTGGGEDALVARYFAPLAAGVPGAFALRDDCAVIAPPPGLDLVVKTDPVRAGVHFFAEDPPADIAWKALAVNISDLVAKGATPLGYLLALSLPAAPDPAWMADFAAGLGAAQSAFGCPLVGGDTDRAEAPLSIAVTAFGTVPAGAMVRRSGARASDRVFVSGTIGDARLGLGLRRAAVQRTPLPDWAAPLTAAGRTGLLTRYLRPVPRLALAPALLAHASAAMDVSDGLVKDFARLVAASDSAGTLHLAAVPFSAGARKALGTGRIGATDLVTAGDDYEILCTVPEAHGDAFRHAARSAGVAVTEIGAISTGTGLVVRDAAGAVIDLAHTGYDHL